MTLKRIFVCFLSLVLFLSLAACDGKDPDEPKEEEIDLSYRVPRSFVELPLPANEIDEESLPKISDLSGVEIAEADGRFSMISGNYRLDFVPAEGSYHIQIVDAAGLGNDPAPGNRVMAENHNPAEIYVQGAKVEHHRSGYSDVEAKDYGLLATASFETEAGSVITVEDRYYFPKEAEAGVFNVRKAVIATEVKPGDEGFASVYQISSASAGEREWFVPNNIFKNFPQGAKMRTYRETQLGLPMMMFRTKATGHTVSLSRYQPLIHYEGDHFASLTADDNAGSIQIDYPSRDTARRFHALSEGGKHVFDLSLRGEKTENYEKATVSTYNAHFLLQNQRIVATDIEEVYRVINEDYKTFIHAVEQVDPDTGKKYTSYGVPWRITIQDGEFGPLTYQAGFIGQQLPAAYNMMLYGIMNDDEESFTNGMNIIDFWVRDAEFMSIAGVPHIWYDTWADGFRAYPSFTRMAVDAMEGLLDAYRLASAHGILRYEWLDALEMYADFLVNNQNEDGSYYRCYNYDGGPFQNWDNGIEEPPGNITQSFSKANTMMPIRFLGKMYELTGNETYKEAAIKAGNYVYENLYPEGSYRGGTCDNPNAVDKEAGVFAMYAFDALYMLTKDEKWLDCLLQATAFTMSTVQAFSFPVKESHLKAAYPLYYGYNDGMSFIVCGSNGVDNYISYIYYQLFRIYILTGDESYLKQAEFIQQNTKSIMNWDGTLGYKYKSLVAEASTIYRFTFSSASDGAWVAWSSVANAEPIAKMLTNFGFADVMLSKKYSLESLRDTLEEIGIGGKAHRQYESTILDEYITK
jgi:hypothetical protein